MNVMLNYILKERTRLLEACFYHIRCIQICTFWLARHRNSILSSLGRIKNTSFDKITYTEYGKVMNSVSEYVCIL